jgi:hypothetical protein
VWLLARFGVQWRKMCYYAAACNTMPSATSKLNTQKPKHRTAPQDAKLRRLIITGKPYEPSVTRPRPYLPKIALQ